MKIISAVSPNIYCNQGKELKNYPVVQVSAGHESGADLGPVISPASKERIQRLVKSAVDEGADVILDGTDIQVENYPNGNFVGPTIINKMNTDMTAYKEEIFGPVLCVLNADTMEDAIEIINRYITVRNLGLNKPKSCPEDFMGAVRFLRVCRSPLMWLEPALLVLCSIALGRTLPVKLLQAAQESLALMF